MKFARKLIHGGGPVHPCYEPVKALQSEHGSIWRHAGQMVLSAWINIDPS